MSVKRNVSPWRTSRPVLALDMTGLWNQKTTGIQRVIREVTPYLAAAAVKRNWDIVLVRKGHFGLEELGHWDGDNDASQTEKDLDRIASGLGCGKEQPTGIIARILKRVARSARQVDFEAIGLKKLIRNIRYTIPYAVRHKVRDWKSRNREICSSADAFLCFSAGILPAMPPPFTPPERAVFVIHDLIPLHHSHYCRPEVATGFLKHVTELVNSPFSTKGRIVTASRHVATDINELFYSLSRKRVAIDLVEWGYDKETFFPQPNSNFRSEHNIPEDALLVAAVSTQDPRKRFADIQTAVEKLDAYAVFLGQGKPRREGNTIYTGYVSDEVVRQAYSSSDVVVNWSAAEGFGLPTIEALACGGRVVIPPDNPTSMEVGGNHVVVAQRADIQALCEAICIAARMPRPQPDLSRFTWANAANSLESLLWPDSTKQQLVA